MLHKTLSMFDPFENCRSAVLELVFGTHIVHRAEEGQLWRVPKYQKKISGVTLFKQVTGNPIKKKCIFEPAENCERVSA